MRLIKPKGEKMSKSSERKARKLANQYEAARLRFANGNATRRDIDMLERMRRENNGVNGYTGESRSSNPTVSKPNGKDNNGANPFAFRVVNPKDEHVFVCTENNEITGECPLKPAIPYILIPAAMWANFMSLAKKFKTEWMALLKGDLTLDDEKKPVYLVKAFYFPPQTATGTSVDIPTGVTPKPGTIGAIHSHVGMGVFFSGTDLAHSNWPIEIVINNKEEYKAVARHQLKCGEYAKNDTKVYLDGILAERETKALELAFQQGVALEKGLATPNRGQSTPPQVPTQPTAGQPTQTAIVPMTQTQRTGTTGESSYGQANPNNSRMCKCGHTFGDHYRTDLQKTNFPDGIMAGMCLDDICKCQRFDEQEQICKCGHSSISHGSYSNNTVCYAKDCHCRKFELPPVIDLTKPLTELERQAIIEADSAELANDPTVQLEFPGMEDSPDDPKAEETCVECEGTKYVDEVVWRSGAKVTVTRICPACGGDGLSELGKLRLAEMKTSMERMDG